MGLNACPMSDDGYVEDDITNTVHSNFSFGKFLGS